MKSLMRLWAFLLIVTYVGTLMLPAVALAAGGASCQGAQGNYPDGQTVGVDTISGQFTYAAVVPTYTCTNGTWVCSQYCTPGSTYTYTGGATGTGTRTTGTSYPTCTLHITPSVIEPGGSASITWTSTNATGGAITNVGNVGPSGSKQIAPPLAQVTTYVGSFTGPGGTANCTASVQVSYGNVPRTFDSGGGPGINPIVNPNPVPINSGTSFSNANTQQPALVQCGTGKNGIADSTNCQACNLAQLVQNIINFCIGLSIPIAAALFAWAGILYFTSGASPGNIEKAKGIFSTALIGFLITITAWIVINTLLHALLDNGKAGFTNSNWFTIQCGPAGARPISGNINQVINSVLSPVNTAPVVSSGQGVYSCAAGWELAGDRCYNPVDGKDVPATLSSPYSSYGCAAGWDLVGTTCINPGTSEEKPATLNSSTYGISGKQCSDDNTACSVDTLQSMGYEPQEANAMSCIAVSESTGNPYTKPSKTGACGLFQITTQPGNWSNPKYHDGITCTVSSSCNDPYCNAQAAQLMFDEQGYQPWTGIDAKTGLPWNQTARNCVDKYDHQAFIDQVL